MPDVMQKNYKKPPDFRMSKIAPAGPDADLLITAMSSLESFRTTQMWGFFDLAYKALNDLHHRYAMDDEGE